MSTYRQQSRRQGSWDDDYPAGRPARRRKRHRGLTALLVVLIVLAAAFFIGDQYARSYAQNMIASKVQSSSKLASKPTVSIKGWPFLTQVATRDVKQVDIGATNVQEQKLSISSINATAHDVRLNSSYNDATIGTVNGTATISYSELAKQSGVKGLSLAPDPSGGPNEAKITLSSLSDVLPASVAHFLPSGPVSGVAKITQSGSSTISVQAVSFGKVPLSQLGQAGDFSFQIPQLPMGMKLTGVSLTQQGLGVQVAAHEVALGGGGLGG